MFSLDSIYSKREYDTTTISNMMAIITAKLAKMRWRNVQFFTVNPRADSKCGEYSRGRCFIYKTVARYFSSRRKKGAGLPMGEVPGVIG